MLHFKNGRVSDGGISFVLPSEFYYCSYDAGEVILENGIKVLSKNRDYCIQYEVYDSCGSTEEEIRKFLKSESSKTISEIKEIECNGLRGHQAAYTYRSGKTQYYEMRLALKDDLQFVFLIEAKGRDVLEIVESEEIQSLIREIRPE